MELTNNNFTASLSSGEDFYGVRTRRGVNSGTHYFEILISTPNKEEEDNFDHDKQYYLSVGKYQYYNIDNSLYMNLQELLTDLLISVM